MHAPCDSTPPNANTSPTCSHAPHPPAAPRPAHNAFAQACTSCSKPWNIPAFIIGRRTDILAANRLACEVLTDFDALPATQRNLARFYLPDPDARDRVGETGTDRRRNRRHAPPRSRPPPTRPKALRPRRELTLRSPEFSTWRNDHRVLRRTHGTKHYHHPVVGDLHFAYAMPPSTRRHRPDPLRLQPPTRNHHHRSTPTPQQSDRPPGAHHPHTHHKPNLR
ncbi:hypothetical protein [Streptomyces pratisoli]|uniref:MmyB family transcriptional regulator n=1 Tax=Streptomyces pratisoli TaxID=3139917 RepID=UPI003C12C474